MIRPKKTIPGLVGAALALNGCGGDSSGGPQSAWGKGLEAFCLQVDSCVPTRAEADTQECLAGTEYYDFLAQYFPPSAAGCDALFASVFACMSAYPCEVIENYYIFECFETLDLGYVYYCYSFLPTNPQFF
jgi:hypothetical protein